MGENTLIEHSGPRQLGRQSSILLQLSNAFNYHTVLAEAFCLFALSKTPVCPFCCTTSMCEAQFTAMTVPR